MESTNNLHHLQDQPQAAVESSSLSTPSCYAVGPASTHSWTPSTITLNAGNNFNPNLQEANPRSRSLTHNKNNIEVPPRPLNDSMIQDLGYHLTSNQQSSSHHHLESQFSVGFPKFSEMLINSAPSSMEGYNRLPPTSTTTHMKIDNNEHKDMNSLMLKTLFSGDHFYSTSAQNYPNFGGTSVPSRENYSQIYPTINISNLNQNQSSACTALDLSMPSLDLDLLTSPPTSFSSGLSHHSQHHHGDNLSFSLHHIQHPSDRSSCSNSTNPSLFTNGTAETKRPACTLMESKASQSQTALKKSRSSESRPSCPPIKVRKEKLGDRIAALQQLVAPFGKTDTASVLMEAIGYIKFLQGQVETLSVPYMKPSQNQTNRVMHGGSTTDGEPKQDLRSRGLCLVPLSCMSYIAGDGGSEVWQQRPNFGGPT